MSDLVTVWIGLRCDGIELDRVKATAAETGRSNGIASYRVTSPVVFTELAADCVDGSLTVHEDEYAPPFNTARLYRALLAGDNVLCNDLTFEKPMAVPCHRRP